MSLTYTAVDLNYITFYSMVSSETNYDFLVFTIDGEEADRWSGQTSWEEHTFRVLPGRHVYSWIYCKDYNVNGGDDAAWIDYIILPYHLDGTTEQTELSLSLHPNPTTDMIHIEIEQDGEFKVEVFDPNGRCILAEKNTTVVSMKDKPAGTYHVVVTQDRQRWTQTLIKM